MYLGDALFTQTDFTRIDSIPVEIQCPESNLTVVKSCLPRRRGRVVTEEQRMGTKNQSMYILKALLPVIESFGFPAEIHARSRGKASVDMTLDKWERVPGCQCFSF